MVIQTSAGRSLKPSQFSKAFDGALKLAKDCECELEDFRKDIVKVACLLIEEGLDLTTFLHKSILNYHAAAFIKELPDERATSFYAAATNEFRKWQSTLSFLRLIDEARYANHYYLNIVAEPHSKLRDALDAPGDISFYNYFMSLSPGISAGLQGSVLVAWGPTPQNRNEIEEEIDSVIIRLIVNLFTRLSPQDLNELKSKSHTKILEGTDTVRIPLKAIIEFFGLDKFRDALRTYENTTYNTIEKYKVIVHNESIQKSIFDDILGSASAGNSPAKKRIPSRKR
ncbi:hypothetical protein [Pseudomonas sp. RA_5y_Pfl1_P24]|uniref:hypothetical protein n=1 Tax=Pseudomonas sp. RA_5y_Pfl1_P24 TaxID=3088706 RepID=UPI0030DD57DC